MNPFTFGGGHFEIVGHIFRFWALDVEIEELEVPSLDHERTAWDSTANECAGEHGFVSIIVHHYISVSTSSSKTSPTLKEIYSIL